MPRGARKKSDTGLYHIMLRGAGRRTIFIDNEDCERFIDTLRRVKEASGFKLYAFCLMGNHVHLLLKEEKESLESIFKRLGASYVYFYNWKYQQTGHLFQDRFRSEAIETDSYFLDVLRYICQNPVKAGLCSTPLEYPWLGCSEIKMHAGMLDTLKPLTDLSGKELLDFIGQPCDMEHLEDLSSKRLTDQEAAVRLCEICGCEYVQEIGSWEVERRDAAIRMAAGLSIRQFSRLTGISKAIIERIRCGRQKNRPRVLEGGDNP